MKIIDKIQQAIAAKQTFYSFEFFPPKTDAGVQNLHLRMERMAAMEPLFIDVTWGAGGQSKNLTLELSAAAQKYLGVEVLMHLTCTTMTVEEIKDTLKAAREAGIQNILALRGDPPKGVSSWEATPGGLTHAIDLVKLIRQEHGDYFGIAVAGHPERHSDSKSKEEELAHLKLKIDAGADFIITQFFYSTDAFLNYVDDCRATGIQCPIIPGIMALQNYTAFCRMTEFCHTKVPPEIKEALEPIKHDDAAVKAYGIKLGKKMCHDLVAHGTPGLHFYTLNLERSVVCILEEGGYTESAAMRRPFPWRASTDSKRAGEDVRPINWANRPQSYVARTEVWDEFPNGRWGDGRSPAFGELSDSHFYRFTVGSKQDRRAMWGEAPISEQEVYDVFAAYVDGKIPKLPWCEVPVQPETSVIRSRLVEANRAGILTINSQPSVNGLRSDHVVFGWGGPGGRVYQKAYVEFFCSPAVLKKVLEACEDRPNLSYIASDAGGQTYSKGTKGTTALTWGVFPNREVIQPTVFDSNAWEVWRKEAFQLWCDLWASLYPEDSKSAELLHQMHDKYFLVAIINHNYIVDDLWEWLHDIIKGNETSGAIHT